MKHLLLSSKRLRPISIFLFLSFLATGAVAQTATVSTDQLDYPPGSTVQISGAGFQPGETVTLQVTHVGATGDDLTSPAHQPWTVTADANGNITSTWYVPVDEDELDATLLLTADGQSSGLHAQTTFTDATLNSVTVDAASGPVTYGTGGVVTYPVHVRTTGSSSALTVTLTTSGLPAAGVTVFWSSSNPAFVSPNTINFSGATTVDLTLTLLVQNNTKVPASPTFTVTATAGGTTKTGNGSLVITPLAITGAITASNKVYDGTTAATIATRTLTGVLFSDNVTYTGGTATFANKTVGTAKTVNATGLSLTGPDAANYTVNATASTTADITQKAITGAITAANKAYDGTVAATISTRTLTGVASGDNVTYTGGTATFSDKNVGNAKTVTATGLSLTGTDAGNYAVNPGASTTANITPKAVTATVTVNDKVYNASTTAVINTETLAGAIAGDDVSVTGGIANFSSASVGTGITVNVINMTLAGADAGNYSFAGTATTTANITVKTITVAITAQNKVYDGTTSVTLISENLVGVEAADVAKLNLTGGTANFDNKNVGTGKTVTSTGYGLQGTPKSNYILNPTSATTTANITPRALTVTASGVNRVYDGTTTATVTLSDNRVSGDVLTDSYSAAAFVNKNAATNKTVNVTGISVSGTDVGNYTLQNTTATTTATISRRALIVSATGVNKVYDGTVAATVTLSDNRVAGDVLTDNNTSASFADKNVGTNKPVSVTGITISGTDALNYNANTTAATTANITPKGLSVTATASNKVYDGNANATATLADNRIAGDVFTDSYATASFSDKNVGTGKTVNVSGISLSGTDAGNYTFNNSTSTAADITTLGITGAVTASDKVYDGNTTAAILTRTLTGTVAGDAVNYTGGAATFDTRNAGTGKTVTATGLSLTGADAGNYTVNSTATTSANITALGITGAVTASDKVYDGNTTAAILTRTLTGSVAGDAVSYTGGAATFDTRNVGAGKTVTATGLSLTGADAGNYTVNSSATTTADITALGITGAVTASDKIYDGNTTAAILTRTLTGTVAGDAVSYTGGAATFDNKNVGTGKTVTATALSLTGADAGNYTVNSSATTTADITALGITGAVTASDKVYDGNTTAAILTRTLTGTVAGDAVSYTGGAATFDNKNVATGKTVTATGLSLTGADAGNYTVNTTATTTANITPLGITGAVTASDKVYDANTTAAILTRTLTGTVAGDAVTYTGGAATFDNKNVGTGKTVTATGLSLSGADAGNYTVNATATTAANITSLGITGAVTASDKVYDANSTATILTRTLTGTVAGDVVTYTGGTATFDNKNVGTGKTVTATGLSLTGADAGNYTVNTTATTTANITAKAITGAVTAANKVYDGNTTASILTRTLTGVITGDVATYTGGAATFDNKNVGTGKTVTATGLGLTGADAGNYTVNTTATTTANITAKAITGAVTAANKVYDGNITATILTRTLTGAVTGDVVTYTGGTATFDNKNVGTGKTVTATGLSLTGADAGNYTVNATATTTANITALAITGAVTAADKVYDGNTTASILTRTLTGVITGDVVTYTGGTATFDNKNVGTGKTVTATGLSLTGADAGNYTVNSTATTTAGITPKAVTAAITANNKVYDGTTAATATGSIPTGLIAGDNVTVIVTNASFAFATVGTWTVTANVALGGAQGGNYSLTSGTASTTATITPLAVTASVSVTPNPQQYSDPVTYTATIVGGAPLVSGGPQAAQSVTFKVGTQTIASNVSLVVNGADLKATYTAPLLEPSPFGTAPTGQMMPGARTATAVINGADPDFSLSTAAPTTTLNITQENARVTYTGGLLVATSSSSATTATVTLTATVQDITAATGDPQYDSYPGDIRNATVTFNIDGSDVATVPVGLVNPADTKTGTAVYTWSGAGLGEHTVAVKVNKYYTNATSGDNTVVIEVYQPNGDFITGGGYLVLTNSNGLKAGDAGSKNNFGFNVKYNKGGSNLQGTINTIVRRTEGGVLHVYQVKGNSMTSLSVNPNSSPKTAIFNGKASITDITNPLSPVGVDGNATLQVNMTDAGDPGTSDLIGIIVYNKTGGVWFSSNWNGTSTAQQLLGGGNLVVHSSTSTTSEPATGSAQSNRGQQLSPNGTEDKFDVKVYGNPTETAFAVKVESTANAPVDIRVYNMSGILVEEYRGAVVQPIYIGQRLSSGMYIMQVWQGKNQSTIKVIKL